MNSVLNSNLGIGSFNLDTILASVSYIYIMYSRQLVFDKYNRKYLLHCGRSKIAPKRTERVYSFCQVPSYHVMKALCRLSTIRHVNRASFFFFFSAIYMKKPFLLLLSSRSTLLYSMTMVQSVVSSSNISHKTTGTTHNIVIILEHNYCWTKNYSYCTVYLCYGLFRGFVDNIVY